MADQNQVQLTLAVQTAQALQTLQAFQQQAQQTLEQVQEGAQSVSNSMSVMAGGIAAAIAAFAIDKVAEFFKGSIELAAEQETQITRLSAAMAQTGEFSEAAVGQMQDFADEMQKTTQFSENAVLSQLAYGKSLGLTNDQAEQLVKVSADLAVATGDTLDGAVEKLGKTYSGSIGRMGMMFPVLKGLTAEQLQAGDAVRVLGDRLEGMAGSQLDTFNGALAQSSHAFDDFRKAIGGLFTDNPVVIAVIKSFSEAFEAMATWVSKNKDELASFIGTGIKVVAAVVPSVIEMFADFVAVLEKVDLAFELAGAGAVDLTNLIAEGVISVFQSATDKILGGVEALLQLAGDVPGVSDVLSKMGIDTDSAAEAVGTLKDNLHDAADNGMRRLEQATKDAYQAVQDTVSFTDKVDEGLKSAVDLADKTAQAYFNASEQAKAAKGVFENQSPGGRLPGFSDQDLQAQLDAFGKFQDEVGLLQASELDKINEAEEQHYAKLDDFRRSFAAMGVDVTQEYAELEDQIHEYYAQKREDELLKEFNQRQEALKKELQGYAESPFKLVIDKLELSSQAFSDFQQSLDKSTQQLTVAGGGLLANVLGGAAGATKLFQSAAGAFADALIPGLGPAVNQIVGVLAQGPDVVKAQVKAFVEAVPDIMEKIGESMPALVEGFVEALKNPQTWIGIAKSVAETLTGGISTWLPELGKQLGIHFGDSLNSPSFSRTVHGWFSGVEENFGKLSSANIGAALEKDGAAFTDGLKHALSSAAVALPELGLKIEDGIKAGAVDLKDAFVEGLGEMREIPHELSEAVFVQVPVAIRKGFLEGIADVRAGMTAVRTALENFVKELVTFATVKMPAAIKEAFDAGVTALKNGLLEIRTVFVQLFTQTLPNAVHAAFEAVTNEFKAIFLEQVPAALKAAGTVFAGALKDAGGAVASAVKGGIGDVVKGIKDTLASVIDPFRQALRSFQFPSIPTPPWLKDFEDAIHNLTNWSLPGLGGGGDKKGPVTGIKGSPFATGITEIPAGFPNDTFPASLSSGERVVDSQTNQDLKRFLSDQGTGGATAALLSQILSVLQSPQSVPVQVKIGSDKIADVMLKLSRTNARVSA